MQVHPDLIVSVSGVRGIVGETLTPSAATAFAAAMGTFLGGKPVVISSDGRPSGEMLRHATAAGLMAAGCQVLDLGVAPTPTVGIAVKKLSAGGGMQITASHNPAPWNGLKMFGDDGKVLSAKLGQQILKIFQNDEFHYATWQKIGTMKTCSEALAWHCQRVLALVDLAAIRSTPQKVFLDANGGSGGPLGHTLLEGLHCDVVTHACHADGNFLHTPEPTAENLVDICPKVAEEHCQIGFVLDPDADRLAIIDEKGNYIGEELTLALAVDFRLQQEKGPVVVNMSTSKVIEDLCQKHGVPFHRSAVGEANVVEKMQEIGAVIGGEGNGGVIDPRVGFVRDPFIGMALILNHLAMQRKPLSEIVANLPKYEIVKSKAQIDRPSLPSLFEKLIQHCPDAKVNQVDGLRLDWEKSWLHIRPSNTEPIVRIISEAASAEQAQRICDQAKAIL